MPFCIRYYSSKRIDLYAISKRLGYSNMTITAKIMPICLMSMKYNKMDTIKKVFTGI